MCCIHCSYGFGSMLYSISLNPECIFVLYCSMQRGLNAFLLCATGGHLPVAEYLAPKMEGHLFDSDDDGNTALHLAAYFGHLSVVKYLVRSCGFNVKAIDKVGLHCLLLVCCIL